MMADPPRPLSPDATTDGDTVSVRTSTFGSATGPPTPSADGSVPLPVIFGFEIESVLGRGGMGVVYKAKHLALKRTVALKMILAGGHSGATEHERFRTEVEAVARLQHPNIVQVFEVGDQQGLPYCALEYVEGGSLGQKLSAGPLPPREAAQLVETMAGAIQLAHSRNIIHRDLKPANVLLTADGTPKVTDFGLARRLDADSGQTRTGAIMGTPSYMAPEQARGETKNVGPAADVYALGAILYECLTGRPPFRGATMVETLDQVRTHEPVAPRRLQPKTPIDLETVCLKCLAKEPERRYSSAKELADDLGRFRRGEPVAARPVGTLERGWRWCRRNRLVASLAGLLSVLLAAGTVVAVVAAVRFNLLANDRQFALDEKAGALDRAETSRQQAEKDRILADERRKEADAERDRAERALAISAQARARTARADGDLMLATDLLNEVPRHVRQWEWRQHRRAFAGTTFVLPGHRGRVDAVDWSPDGKVLASADQTGRVILHDAGTGEQTRSFAAHDVGVGFLKFSPDGSRFASLGFNAVARVWDATSCVRLLETKAAGIGITCLAWSLDGRQLVAGCEDGKVRFLDAGDGLSKRALDGGKNRIVSLALNADGRHLAVCDGDKRLVLWDLRAGEIARTLEGNHDSMNVLLFSPDGEVLAGGGGDESIHIWNVSTGKLVSELPLYARPDPLRGYRTVVTGLSFRPDGRRLASCCGGYISTRPGMPVLDRTLRIWDVRTGASTMVGTGPAGPIAAVRYSPDGRHIVSGGATGVYSPDGDLRVWDVRGEGDHRSLGHDYFTTGLSFSPDGSRLATVCGSHQHAGDVGNLRVWDPATATLVLSVFDSQPLESVCYSATGRQLITGTGKGAIQFRDARTGQVSQSWVGHQKAVLAIAVSPDAQRLVTAGGDGAIRLWNSQGKLVAEVLRSGSVHSVAFSTDGLSIAAAATRPDSNAKNVLLWRPADSNEPAELGTHQGGARGVAFSPGGQTLASVGIDGVMRGWSLPTLREQFSVTIPKSGEAAVAFSADSQRIATASGDRAVIIWDIKTAQEVVAFTGPEYLGRCIAFSPNGQFLAAGNGLRTTVAGPGEVRLWDARSIGRLNAVEIRTRPRAVWFADDGQRLFARDRDGNGFAWSTPDLRRLAIEVPATPTDASRSARSNDGTFEAVGRLESAIELTDLRPTPAEIAERRAMAEPDPAWHANQAWRALTTGPDDAIVFHAVRSTRSSSVDAYLIRSALASQQRQIAKLRQTGDVRLPEAERLLRRLMENLADLRPHEPDALGALAAVALAPNWIDLRPEKAKSAGAATLTIRPDHSILASGVNPDKDSYSFSARAPVAGITGIRLETMADPSLPFAASGRAPGNGNFALGEIVLELSDKPVPFTAAWADQNALAKDHYLKQDMRAAWAIDGDPKTYWNPWPTLNLTHYLVAETKTPTAKAGDALTIRLDFKTDDAQHNLGCFRVAVTANARPVLAARLHRELPQRPVNAWTILAAAAWLRGDWPGVLTASAKARALPSGETPIDAALTALARARLDDTAGAEADLKRARSSKGPTDPLLADLIAEAELALKHSRSK